MRNKEYRKICTEYTTEGCIVRVHVIFYYITNVSRGSSFIIFFNVE